MSYSKRKVQVLKKRDEILCYNMHFIDNILQVRERNVNKYYDVNEFI